MAASSSGPSALTFLYLPSSPRRLTALIVDGESEPTLTITYSGGSILRASRAAARFLFGISYPTCSTTFLPGQGSLRGPPGANSGPTAGYTSEILPGSTPMPSTSSQVLRELTAMACASFMWR